MPKEKNKKIKEKINNNSLKVHKSLYLLHGAEVIVSKFPRTMVILVFIYYVTA